MLKAIRHPNIISLLDVIPVHTGGRRPDFHLIFEYLDHDLAGLMASGEVVLQEQHVKHCLYELLRGLEYLHNRCKLIHRDVKLSNILVGKDGSIKIADFGLARQHYSDKRDYTGRVVTLWYRAPELLLGIKNYSTAIDIWAAGCVFSEIVFGKPAFPGETEIQQLTLICKVVGAPNKENFSDFEKLPIKVSKDYPRTFDQRYAKFNKCNKRFKKKSPEGFKLLSRMLEIDPHKRITATEALSHSYFLQKPYPDKPKLSDILPSHDYESRMRRQNIKKRKLNN